MLSLCASARNKEVVSTYTCRQLQHPGELLGIGLCYTPHLNVPNNILKLSVVLIIFTSKLKESSVDVDPAGL